MNSPTVHSSEIRETFLHYFAEQGHQRVPSASLVPVNDPTILFTNAGMAPFKDTFLGLEKRDYKRATSSQRCVRAGGKHNDLENVGQTARHHTFFEMLGNFSFGDYFKGECIDFAWDLLVNRYKLSADRLWITVHEDDDEAAQHWTRWVDSDRILHLDDENNFWSMGAVGPCGPCSEVFYDHGDQVAGGLPGTPEADGDRYVEIWNLVFMQQQRLEDGSSIPLPKPSVDTGMGLERMAAVLQGSVDNYETDLFTPLLKAAASTLGMGFDSNNTALRVLADHVRSCSFLLLDGVLPSNEGRGYVLRRILRRAVRHGYQQGCDTPFFHLLVDPLVEQMQVVYPDLAVQRQRIIDAILLEEQQFSKTLKQGMDILGEAVKSDSDTLDGELAFTLYDTYGFPVDLTADIAREHGMTVDMAQYQVEMEQQRERGRNQKRKTAYIPAGFAQTSSSQFLGYTDSQAQARVVAIVDQTDVSEAHAGDRVAILLDETPFYAESGGQVGDTGTLKGENFDFAVEDTQKAGELILHYGTVTQGSVAADSTVHAQIDNDRRRCIARNHSATHLLNAALRQVLGEGVSQRGSMVAEDYMRFDFSHPKSLEPEEMQAIENIVNEQILANTPVETEEMPIAQAIEAGATALFDEKYGDVVRVLRMGGDFSIELCGGTHVQHTGDIGLFVLTEQSSIAAGVRRIEAISGIAARQWLLQQQKLLNQITKTLGCGIDQIDERLNALLERNNELETQVAAGRKETVKGLEESLLPHTLTYGDTRLLVAQLNQPLDSGELRDLSDQLRQHADLIVLASGSDGAVRIVASVSEHLHPTVKAKTIVQDLASQLGGKGGGRDDFAQGGAPDWAGVASALESVREQLNGALN